MRPYVFVALASCYVAYGQPQPCTLENNEFYHDLSPLQAKTDYEFKSATGRMFKLNVCGPVVSETWNLENPQSVGAFYRGSRSDVSIGSVNTTLRIVDSSPLIILTGGSPCSGAGHAATAVRFICDHSVFGAGQPQLVAQLPTDGDDACAFFVEWRTHVACPTARPSGAGGVVAVIAVVILSLLMLYVIVGVLYRRFALGYRGFAQFPRTSLIPFSALPSFANLLDWLQDIRDHLRGGARDLWPRSSANARRPRASNWGRRNDGFAPLAREEREAMFHDGPDAPDARFSLEDDADHEGAQELVESRPSVPAKPPVPAKDGEPDTGPIRL